jgi:hypothetical protein
MKRALGMASIVVCALAEPGEQIAVQGAGESGVIGGSPLPNHTMV